MTNKGDNNDNKADNKADNNDNKANNNDIQWRSPAQPRLVKGSSRAESWTGTLARTFVMNGFCFLADFEFMEIILKSIITCEGLRTPLESHPLTRDPAICPAPVNIAIYMMMVMEMMIMMFI